MKYRNPNGEKTKISDNGFYIVVIAILTAFISLSILMYFASNDRQNELNLSQYLSNIMVPLATIISALIYYKNLIAIQEQNKINHKNIEIILSRREVDIFKLDINALLEEYNETYVKIPGKLNDTRFPDYIREFEYYLNLYHIYNIAFSKYAEIRSEIYLKDIHNIEVKNLIQNGSLYINNNFLIEVRNFLFKLDLLIKKIDTSKLEFEDKKSLITEIAYKFNFHKYPKFNNYHLEKFIYPMVSNRNGHNHLITWEELNLQELSTIKVIKYEKAELFDYIVNKYKLIFIYLS